MPDDIVVFLTRARELIVLKKRRFVARNYQGKSYKEVLLEDFGIGFKRAWEVIYSLTKHDYVLDEKPNYLDRSDAYVFKRQVNG